MKLLMKPEIGSLSSLELSVAQPFSIEEESGQIAVYILHNPDDQRWKRIVNFVVLGTGNIPAEFDLFSPIGTVNLFGTSFHLFYKITE